MAHSTSAPSPTAADNGRTLARWARTSGTSPPLSSPRRAQYWPTSGSRCGRGTSELDAQPRAEVPWKTGGNRSPTERLEVAAKNIPAKEGLQHVYFSVQSERNQRPTPEVGRRAILMARTRGGPAPHHAHRLNAEKAGLLPISSLDGAHVVPIEIDGLDRRRLERLRATGVHVRQPRIGELVREDAARAQASVPFVSPAVDVESFRSVLHLLVDHYYRVGQVDARRALRRANIDRYLVETNRGSRRTVRWQLYNAGRVWKPGEFPPARVLEAPRQQPTSPMSSQQIAALYTVSQFLGERERGMLLRLLDFVGGVGARPAELRVLRRGDVCTEEVAGRTWTMVTLQTSAGRPRTVPVLDEEVAQRIQRYADTAPHELIMALGDEGTIERNAFNRPNETLALLGYKERLDIKALRNSWLAYMAGVLPVSPYLQVAGLGAVPRLADLGLDRESPGDLAAVTAVLASAEQWMLR